MMRLLPAVLAVITCIVVSSAQEPVTPDTLPAPTDTMFVIPAGPVAGSFTSAARVSVLDTIAGWAKIQVEGWVPVQAVADRLTASSVEPTSVSAPAPRHQCEAITKKGTRCKRMAVPGSKYCWQHQPGRAK